MSVADPTNNSHSSPREVVVSSILDNVFGVCEVGVELLTYFSEGDPELDKIRKEILISDHWNDEEFFDLSRHLKNHNCEIDIRKVDLE